MRLKSNQVIDKLLIIHSRFVGRRYFFYTAHKNRVSCGFFVKR